MSPNLESLIKTNMNVLHSIRRKNYRKSATSKASAETAGKPETETVREDDATVLSTSFASLSMMSSSTTINHEQSFASSMTTTVTTMSMRAQPEGLFSYKLHKNKEHTCFGYLQFQANASCLQDVPTELAMVSGKPIFYIQTDLPDGHVRAGREVFSHPLFVEVLQSLFIPVVVTSGIDKPVARGEGRSSPAEGKLLASWTSLELTLSRLFRFPTYQACR